MLNRRYTQDLGNNQEKKNTFQTCVYSHNIVVCNKRLRKDEKMLEKTQRNRQRQMLNKHKNETKLEIYLN